jgi:arylformamidase
VTTELDWNSGAFERIDLTRKLRNGMAVWPTHPKFRQEVVSSFERGDIACNHSLSLSEHSGTHFDAPLHFVPGGRSIDTVPLDRFFGRMVTIDASDMAPDSEAEPERIIAFESRHGPILPGDAVMFHFGWERFWDHPTESQRYVKDWPGLSRAACELLVARRVRLVACDCMSIDRYGSIEFPAHRTLLGADILVGENFANLSRVPPVCYLTTLPLPIEGGSGSPLRAIAFIPRGSEPKPA